MKKTIWFATWTLALSAILTTNLSAQTPAPAAAPTTQAADPNRVVLRVGNQSMTAQQFEDFVNDLPPQVQEAARGPQRRMVADQVVRVKLMAQAATDQGLDKTPAFQRQMAMLREQVLAQMLAEQMQNSDDAKLQAYYQTHKTDFETATARHILIRSAGSPVPATPGKKELTDAEAKAKAEEIRSRIVGGEDFATIAKSESDDAGSAEHGGDLGTFGRGQMVPQFDAAVFALKPGEISEPIKTQFGYHIIQLLDKKQPTFEEVKPDLASKFGGQKVEDLVQNLKRKTPTMIDDQYFGPASAMPTRRPHNKIEEYPFASQSPGIAIPGLSFFKMIPPPTPPALPRKSRGEFRRNSMTSQIPRFYGRTVLAAREFDPSSGFQPSNLTCANSHFRAWPASCAADHAQFAISDSPALVKVAT